MDSTSNVGTSTKSSANQGGTIHSAGGGQRTTAEVRSSASRLLDLILRLKVLPFLVVLALATMGFAGKIQIEELGIIIDWVKDRPRTIKNVKIEIDQRIKHGEVAVCSVSNEDSMFRKVLWVHNVTKDNAYKVGPLLATKRVSCREDDPLIQIGLEDAQNLHIVKVATHSKTPGEVHVYSIPPGFDELTAKCI